MSRVYSVCPGSLGATKEKDQVSLSLSWCVLVIAAKTGSSKAAPSSCTTTLFLCATLHTSYTSHTQRQETDSRGRFFYIFSKKGIERKKKRAPEARSCHTLWETEDLEAIQGQVLLKMPER